MDLSPAPDQQALIDATVEWCRDNLPLEHARARPADLWGELENMGWLGMTASHMGLDHATEALVFAELGRFLAPIGMISSAVAARWSDRSGKVALTIAADLKTRVFDANGATEALGIVEGQVATAVLPRVLDAEPGLDLSSPLTVFSPPLAFTPLNEPQAALHLQLLAGAFAVGCADAARDMAAGYAKARDQFERPIGWFQALKHLCSDMAVRSAVARSQLYYAACALDAHAPDAAFHVAAAKRLSDQAALENGRVNIQVHGGIGMTDEASPHLCLKRAHLLAFVAPASTATLLGEAA